MYNTVTTITGEIMHKRKKQKRWTQSDLEYLKNNYGKIPAKTIAEKLNKT